MLKTPRKVVVRCTPLREGGVQHNLKHFTSCINYNLEQLGTTGTTSSNKRLFEQLSDLRKLLASTLQVASILYVSSLYLCILRG